MSRSKTNSTICVMSIDSPGPTSKGGRSDFKPFNTGVKIFSKISNSLLYLAFSLSLYCNNLENRNNPMISAAIINFIKIILQR